MQQIESDEQIVNIHDVATQISSTVIPLKRLLTLLYPVKCAVSRSELRDVL